MHKAGPGTGLPEGRRGARCPPCSGAGRPPDRVPPRQVRRSGPQPACPEARRYLLVPFPAPGLRARQLRPSAAAGRGGNTWFGGRAGSGDPGRGTDKCRGSRGSRGAPRRAAGGERAPEPRAVRRGRGRGRLRSAPGVGARGRRCPRKRGEPGVGAAARETRPQTLLARVVRLLVVWNRSQLALAPGARLSCGCPCPREAIRVVSPPCSRTSKHPSDCGVGVLGGHGGGIVCSETRRSKMCFRPVLYPFSSRLLPRPASVCSPCRARV